MGKIKETITALIAGEEPGAVHINRKEHIPVSDDRFCMVIGCILKVSAIVSGTILILFAGIWKVIALLVFGMFLAMLYFPMKD